MCTAPAASEGWTLLTGGNRGLGLGIARKLASDGRKVLLASRTLPAAKKAADAIAAATPQHPGCVRCAEAELRHVLCRKLRLRRSSSLIPSHRCS